MVRRSKRIVASALLIVIVVFGATRPAAANPNVYEPANDPALGFNLIAWSGNSGSSWSNAVDALYTAGFREVSISSVRRVDIATGNITTASYPTLTAIDAGVARAKQLGMRVTLNPFVELSSGDWRKNFAPLPGSSVANTFWPQYESYLDEVATIAQNRGVDAINVGTEMKGLDSFYTVTDFDPSTSGNQPATQAQLDQQKGYWNTVIDSAAGIYGGQIGYASNWDNFNSSLVTSNIWSHPEINYIGIDSYFTFTNSPYSIPSSATSPIQSYPDESFIQLVASEWSERLDNQILPFAGSLSKPVVFTEQGYQHHNNTARTPQTEAGSVDTSEQIMAFQGMLRALDGRQASVRAMHIWQWEMTGSQGSTWNINPSASANQPDNRRLAIWLSRFARNVVDGDYNGDAIVDTSDYIVWRKTMGQSTTFFSGADGNGSGSVDANDYAVWRLNFGSAPGSGLAGSETIPEPAMAWLVVCGLCSCAVSRRTCAIRLPRR